MPKARRKRLARIRRALEKDQVNFQVHDAMNVDGTGRIVSYVAGAKGPRTGQYKYVADKKRSKAIAGAVALAKAETR